jgi:hypothetical protein
MSTNFNISVKKQHHNLHVEIQGDFDGNSAWELVNLLHEKYDGSGDVVIDGRNLGEICPFGCGTFQCRLNRLAMPAERLVFQGEKAGRLAPAGSRIITDSEVHLCRCNGKCRRCKCAENGRHVRH